MKLAIYLKVVRVPIHSTEEVFFVDCVICNYLPGTTWDFKRNEGLSGPVVLECVTDFTFRDGVDKIFVHARPVNCFSGSSEAALYSCVSRVFQRSVSGTTALSSLNIKSSCLASSSLIEKYGCIH